MALLDAYHAQLHRYQAIDQASSPLGPTGQHKNKPHQK